MVGGTTTTYNIPDQIILLRLFIWHFTVGGILLDSNSVTSITVVVHNIIIIMLRYVFVASILNYHGVEYNQGELGSMSSLSGVLHSTEWLSSNRLQVHKTAHCTSVQTTLTVQLYTHQLPGWEYGKIVKRMPTYIIQQIVKIELCNCKQIHRQRRITKGIYWIRFNFDWIKSEFYPPCLLCISIVHSMENRFTIKLHTIDSFLLNLVN